MTHFYQSPSDKARFDVLLKVLSEEGPNLAIIGDDEVALAHYGRTIYQRLSQLPNAQVDLWGAIDAEKLVSRFNEILAELTLEQAQDKSQKAPIRRCFIITDAHAVQTLELQLLSRLIQGFPASHVHAVLLIHRNEPYQKKLEVFGKSLLRWELESEHPAPVRMQRIETRDVETPAPAAAPVASTASVLGTRQASRGAAGAVAASAPALSQAAAPSAADPVSASAPATPPSALPEFDHPVSGELPQAAPGASGKPPARGSRLGWGLLLALLMALTVMAALNLDRISQELEQLERYVSGKRAPGAQAESEAAKAAASVNMSSSTQLPVKPDDSLIPDKESIVSPSEAGTPPANAGATPPNAVAATPAASSVAAPTPAVTPAPAPPVTPSPAPTPAAGKDPLLAESRQWVRDLPANGWVLQHAALDTLDEAKKLKAGTSSLQEARILMTQRKAKGYYYIVVTGPYANRAAAQDQMKKNPSWTKAWLRGPKSMQQQFED